jgi:hypothetical protein
MILFRKILILWSALLFPGLVIAGWFGGPNDYNSCILESMKGVTSDVAARMIRSSCREKFPEKAHDEVELPESALQKIEGKGNSSDNNKNFEGTIFNGNSDWTVSSLEIRITDKETKAFRDYKVSFGGIGTSYRLPPTMTGHFSFQPYELPKDYSWTILRIYGYQK